VHPAILNSSRSRHAPNRAKNLLDTVAHELRNPLASLRLSLDMLVLDFDRLEPEAKMGLVRRAQRSASWLQTLAENLTCATSVESGHLEVRVAHIDVLECVQTAITLVHGLLEQRGQRMRVLNSAGSTLALADPARVIQIIANLLSNASRYSIDGDEIELHVTSLGQTLRLRVTDHGPGISAEDQQRIFGAWVRVDGARAGGLGLGLSIVQSLVQQQGGRVGVESTLGEGASFWFTLPAATCSELEAGVACQA
jgi:signal transduction histidine kinase